MKYALVGGWGYVGANLAERLNSCVIARKSSAEKRPFLREAFKDKEVILVNEFSREELERALGECKADALVYLAGKIKGRLEEMREAHVEKALLALDVAKGLGLRYVYVSSVAAMGIADACEEDYVREEEELLKGCVPFGKYSKTKAEGELKLYERSKEVGIVRPALVVGKYAYHPEWRLLEVARAKGVPVPNLSATTIPCLTKAIEEASRRPGWYLAVDKTLKDLGFKTFELRPPGKLIKLLPDPVNLALLVMRYRYASRKLKC